VPHLHTPARLVAFGAGLAGIVCLALAGALFMTGRIGGEQILGEVEITESQLARLDREVHSAMAGGAPDPGDDDVALCRELGAAVQVAPGDAVVLYDESGSVIGRGTLGPARMEGDRTSAPSGDVTVCQMQFYIGDIRRTDKVTLEVGSVRRGTYSMDQLEADQWFMVLRLGS
jgi:hypothetical protein